MKPLITLSFALLFIASLALNTQQIQAAQELSPSAQALQEAMPEYISITSITETESQVRFTGEAASYQQITNVLRLFDDRDTEPDLKEISSQGSESGFVFVLDLSK
ncbi:MAG: hypothetical protein GKR91_20610 [Pseudomonadales bacterium]|nr:hypothetical protein [Pseudomonadales bacterium]